MIFIWHECGWVLLLAVGLFYGLFEWIIQSTMGTSPHSKDLIAGLAYFCSAFPCWLLAFVLRRRPTQQYAINLQNGEQVPVAPTYHALFFIPIRFWTPIFLGIGLYYIIISL